MVPAQRGKQEVLEKCQLLTSSLSPYTESCPLPSCCLCLSRLCPTLSLPPHRLESQPASQSPARSTCHSTVSLMHMGRYG